MNPINVLNLESQDIGRKIKKDYHLTPCKGKNSPVGVRNRVPIEGGKSFGLHSTI